MANQSYENINSLKKCYQAFDRLKEGIAEKPKFLGIKSGQITPSIVSQEAGFDAGYLKKGRVKHRALIEMINTYATESKNGSTLSKAEIIRRERIKLNACKEELLRVQHLLEQSLSREVLLSAQLAELEKLAFVTSKVTQIKPSI